MTRQMTIESGASPRPTPQIDATNKPYFDAIRQNSFQLQQCRGCRSFVFFPRAACPNCLSPDFDWVEVDGHGVVHSFAVVQRPHHPAFYGDVPIVFAAVKLPEGPTVLAEIRGTDPAEVQIGMPVRVDFVSLDERIAIPVWVSALTSRDSA